MNAWFIIPWIFKVFYGLISDTFPIARQKRRPYLIFNGIFASSSMLALLLPMPDSILTISILGISHMTAFAFIDVIVDSVMVFEAKKDPVKGSEDLQSLAFATHSITGIFSAIIGALFT